MAGRNRGASAMGRFGFGGVGPDRTYDSTVTTSSAQEQVEVNSIYVEQIIDSQMSPSISLDESYALPRTSVGIMTTQRVQGSIAIS